MKKRLKTTHPLILDSLGVFLIIVSPITGLVPGPGGIPVFFAGLSLLAINHTWARRMLHYLKDTGSAYAKRIFQDRPILKLAYDVISIAIMFLATWIIIKTTSDMYQALAIIMLCAATGLFIGNRRRLERLLLWAKRSKA